MNLYYCKSLKKASVEQIKMFYIKATIILIVILIKNVYLEIICNIQNITKTKRIFYPFSQFVVTMLAILSLFASFLFNQSSFTVKITELERNKEQYTN